MDAPVYNTTLNVRMTNAANILNYETGFWTSKKKCAPESFYMSTRITILRGWMVLEEN